MISSASMQSIFGGSWLTLFAVQSRAEKYLLYPGKSEHIDIPAAGDVQSEFVVFFGILQALQAALYTARPAFCAVIQYLGCTSRFHALKRSAEHADIMWILERVAVKITVEIHDIIRLEQRLYSFQEAPVHPRTVSCADTEIPPSASASAIM